LSANFRGNGDVHQRLLATENRVPGLSHGVAGVVLRLAVLIQYRRVTGEHISRHRHTDTRRQLMPAHSYRGADKKYY